jgi:hypothetical protein
MYLTPPRTTPKVDAGPSRVENGRARLVGVLGIDLFACGFLIDLAQAVRLKIPC